MVARTGSYTYAARFAEAKTPVERELLSVKLKGHAQVFCQGSTNQSSTRSTCDVCLCVVR
jgi:hypothetical protein